MLEALDLGLCACTGTGKRFCEACHRYWDDDRQLISVTSLIQTVWPRSDGAPEAAIEKARMRGAWVDGAFMEYLTFGSVGVPPGTPQEYADCLGMAIDWWEAERAGAEVICQVRLFGDNHAGTADLIVDRCEILEFKCTWEISRTVPAQLGGYGELYEAEDRTVTPIRMKAGVLHCHRRLKKAKFQKFDYNEATRQWRVVRDFWRLTRAA